MIGYSTIGVKDLDAAKKFYSELLDSKVLVDVGRRCHDWQINRRAKNRSLSTL